MTARDRTIVLVMLVVGLLGGFWLGVLGPKRRDAKALSESIATVQARLDEARAHASQAQAAKARYLDDYATVVRLGKAVPVDESTASLVYQLESAVDRAKMDLRSVKLAVANPASSPAATQAANASSSTSSTSSGSSSSGASSSSTVPAATSTTPTATSTAPADASSSPGTATGFVPLPFTFVVTGRFFNAQRLLDALDAFVSVHGTQIQVQGRLVSIDGFSLQASARGLPNIQASISATAYLLPSGSGLTGGATEQGPAGAPEAAPSGSSAPAPPTATVTGVAR